MKNKPTYGREKLRAVVPALMLAALLSTIAIPTLHSFHECGNAPSCAICTFQLSTFTLASNPAAGADPVEFPLLHSILPVLERIPEPFHISVFANHAPPQFC